MTSAYRQHKSAECYHTPCHSHTHVHVHADAVGVKVHMYMYVSAASIVVTACLHPQSDSVLVMIHATGYDNWFLGLL